jgi:hypothetical protein
MPKPSDASVTQAVTDCRCPQGAEAALTLAFGKAIVDAAINSTMPLTRRFMLPAWLEARGPANRQQPEEGASAHQVVHQPEAD